jgi:pimeloyl-ACP methyl ester carboxylesterase
MTMRRPDVASNGPGEGGSHAREQLLGATPATERHLMLAGISTAVLIGGDGPPIVLLHGPGEFALTWMRVMPELAKTNRVIVPDLPGHGGSLLGDAALDPDHVIAWLGELIEQTCLRRPIWLAICSAGPSLRDSPSRTGNCFEDLFWWTRSACAASDHRRCSP